MSWNEVSAADWEETARDLIDAVEDPEVSTDMARYQFGPLGGMDETTKGAIHQGTLRVSGDFTPPAILTIIDGDLIVDGQASTANVDGYDGNATLLVFGDLKCARLINEWASLIYVTGSCDVAEWTLASREDSSLSAGHSFRSPIFVGGDIWVTVGKSFDVDYAFGYGLLLDEVVRDIRPLSVLGPRQSEAAALSLLQLDPNSSLGVLERLEARFYETGTILP